MTIPKSSMRNTSGRILTIYCGVDFYCPKSKLVIEVDGGQHYCDKGKEKDKIRDDYMKEAGINTIRVYAPIDDSNVLDAVHHAGIKIIMGFGFNQNGVYDML